MVQITLLGRVPSKKNDKQIVWNRKTNRPFILSSKKHNDWHKGALAQILAHKVGKIEKVVTIEMMFYPPDNHKADLTNKAESVMDALVDAGVLVDDNWFVVPNVRLQFGGKDAKRPRVEVNIF